MSESPVFSRMYDFVLWLIPQATKFPRVYRFTLAERLQRHTLDLQETLIAAGLRRDSNRLAHLQKADVQLAQLRHTVRLCKDFNLFTLKQYEYASEHLTEIGKLLGSWIKKNGADR